MLHEKSKGEIKLPKEWQRATSGFFGGESNSMKATTFLSNLTQKVGLGGNTTASLDLRAETRKRKDLRGKSQGGP